MTCLMIKLDPDRPLDTDRLHAVMDSGAEGIIIGGTQSITREKVIFLWNKVRSFPGRRILEITDLASAIGDVDEYWIPVVLNANEPEWIIKAQARAISQLSTAIPWEKISSIGYIVLNGNSAVATVTGANTQISDDELFGLVMAGHKLFGLPWLYIEYSGRWGDIERLARLRGKAPTVPLIYGGGIRRGWQAKTMSQFCDIIVVGNMIYEERDLKSALRDIRQATQSRRKPSFGY